MAMRKPATGAALQPFTTAIENDDCEGAINVPVNTGAQCLESVEGTVTGATPSGIASSCSWEGSGI